MIKKSAILLLFALQLTSLYAQQLSADALIPYLHGVRVRGALSLNVRGYEVVVAHAAGRLEKPRFAGMFPEFGLRQGYTSVQDTMFGEQVVAAKNREKAGRAGSVYNTCFFFQHSPDSVLGIWIAGIRDPGRPLERAFLDLARNVAIPDSLLSGMMPPMSLALAGRTIPVDNSCRWMGPSTLQCPSYGELNWSLHPDAEEARQQTEAQASATRSTRKVQVEREKTVQISFEGSPVTAKRLQ